MKKKRMCYAHGLIVGFGHKNGLRMRLTLLLLLTGFFNLVASESYSQLTKLSISLKNATVEQVLANIEDNSEFNFVYNRDVINLKRKVDVDFSDSQIDDILKDLFKDTNVRYRLIDRTIVLSTIAGFVPVGQMIQLTGKVSDTSGIPLPGVTVVVKGTTNGTVTNPDGRYTLSSVPADAVIQFSFVGMKMQEIPVAGKSSIDVVMEEDAIGLEEVVAIGYGTVKKSDLTGAVGAIKSDDFNAGANSNIQQLFQGKIAGARVVQNSGEPGGGISLTIRGASSINAGTTPLYVIDGVPLDNSAAVTSGGDLFSGSFTPRSPLGTINTNDIESIEILKDASASAIYGARAANGVVLITTKKGKEGRLSVNYNAYIGIQSPSYKYDLLTPEQYKTVVNEIIDAGGASEEERVGEIIGGGTDWQEEIFNRNSIVMNHNLSFSGGNEKTTYLSSLSFMSQPGVIINNDFKRYTARINVDHNFNDVLKVGLRLSSAYTDEAYIPYGTGYNEWAGVINAALNYDPSIPVEDENGDYSLSNWIAIDNPLAIANGISSKSNRYNNFFNFFAEYFIIPDLSIKLNVGAENTNEVRRTYISRKSILGRGTGGTASILNGTRSNYLVESFANYKKVIGQSVLSALAGITTQKFSAFNSYGSIANFPSDATGANNLGLGDPSLAKVNSNKSSYVLNSFFGRVNYSLFDKYLLTGTVRMDGSSRFGENNKYGIFPSVALGWKVTNEEFLKDNETLTSLKLRASWGETGNQNIGNYLSLSTFSEGPKAVFDGELVGSTVSSRIPNPDLKWEKTAKTDIGVDFELYGGKIAGTIDYFNQKTTDMLISLPVPKSTGYGDILQNIGSIENSGWELGLTTRNISRSNFKWKTDINLTTVKNEVLDIGNVENIISGNTIIQVGEALRSFYGYEVIGTWQIDDDYSTTLDNMQPGDYKFRDVNGDKQITADDRVILGNSFPKLVYGITNSLSYKRFQLDFVFDGITGAKKYNENVAETFNPINFRRNKIAEPYLNRWTPENPTNEYPSFVRPKALGDKATASSYTITDASYIKLSSVQLSYELPKISRTITSASVYVTGQNLFVISDFMGDPSVETGSNSSVSVSDNAYPLPRTFMVGINLNF